MQAQAHEERVGGSGGRSSVPGKETAARVAGLDLSAAAQRARRPPAQRPGECIVNVTELNWADLVSPFQQQIPRKCRNVKGLSR